MIMVMWYVKCDSSTIEGSLGDSGFAGPDGEPARPGKSTCITLPL